VEIASPAPVRSPGGWGVAAQLIATVFGAGYSPLIPGTAGSAVGVFTFIALHGTSPLTQVVVTLVVFGVGTLAATHTATRVGRKDPGIVVIDEVVGQWVSLLFLPFTPATALVGFLLFRVMDIVKPWPARDFEAWPGGLGIMADDVMAGIYANLLLRIALIVVPFA
jgi:phosphatidylglycerophosphatase A